MVGMAKGMTAFALAKIQRGLIRFVTFFHELLAVVLANSQSLSLFVYAHQCFESITTCIAWPKGWEGFGLPGSIEPLAIPMANIPDFARGVVFVADRLWRGPVYSQWDKWSKKVTSEAWKSPNSLKRNWGLQICKVAIKKKPSSVTYSSRILQALKWNMREGMTFVAVCSISTKGTYELIH